MIAQTPKTPYYAVIFTSIRTPNDNGYTEMAAKMLALASQQEGFLGVETARNEVGITISYWKNLQAIKNWKANTEHIIAQEKGKTDWYKHFKVRIALVERDYSFEKIETEFEETKVETINKEQTLNELRDKILKGIEIAFQKLLIKKKAEDGELVFSKDGEIITIKARDM